MTHRSGLSEEEIDHALRMEAEEDAAEDHMKGVVEQDLGVEVLV
jgi:hypothetical protein